MKRNAIMLEQTKDTITVPAAFMIRMLACIHSLRNRERNTNAADPAGASASTTPNNTPTGNNDSDNPNATTSGDSNTNPDSNTNTRSNTNDND